jgi:hypothetical protein
MDDHHFSQITNLGRKKSPAHKGGLGFLEEVKSACMKRNPCEKEYECKVPSFDVCRSLN